MHTQNYTLAQDPLSLDRIRGILNRLEDTIIFSLIERAQFAHNPIMYRCGEFPELVREGFEGSWLDWTLQGIESFHAKARRYTSPDEYPFTPIELLPKPIITPLVFPKILHPNNINVNASILSYYVRTFVPRVTRQVTIEGTNADGEVELEDDGNYGSAATLDVEVLQAISRRVHYGKFVSESKFTSHPSAFITPILARDRAALEALVTKPDVERALLARLRIKAATYAQNFESPAVVAAGAATAQRDKVDVDGVVDLYESFIIPLTKEVEVEYLLHRLDGLTQHEIDELNRSEST